MALPDSYTLKPGSVPSYFEAMLRAEAPERFTTRFLESLEFKSTNDRLFINVLKDLGFIDADGVPQDRYYRFLDSSISATVVAEGVREAFSDLFAINKNAESLTTEEVKNKLRTLYKGTKKDNIINRIASTFTALCDFADFSKPGPYKGPSHVDYTETKKDSGNEEPQRRREPPSRDKSGLSLDSLQYNINIVLPESRDQAVYDAIFTSLRNHLGTEA